MLSGSQCIMDPAQRYTIVATYVNNSITISVGTTSCGVYSIRGWRQGSQIITLTTAVAITIPHIKLRLIFFALLEDDWSPATDYVQAKINTTNASVIVYVSSRSNF
jgi:hypothetical protein